MVRNLDMLAMAVVEQAIDDYKTAIINDDLERIEEIEDFFDGLGMSEQLNDVAQEIITERAS